MGCPPSHSREEAQIVEYSNYEIKCENSHLFIKKHLLHYDVYAMIKRETKVCSGWRKL